MTRFCVGLFVLLMSSAGIAQQTNSCPRATPDWSCKLQAGWGGPNGPFLEGLGLETLHFASGEGSPKFPPAAGSVLNLTAVCGTAPAVSVNITKCGKESKGSAACTVHILSGGPICALKDNVDPSPDEPVIAVRGYWDGTGTWVNDRNAITLACNVLEAGSQGVNSAVGTCVAAGYSPNKDSALFLACIRAVRGDYCGDGISHTMPRTQIALHDPKVNPLKGKGEEGLYDEATWSPNGALCVHHYRWNGDHMSGDPVWQECGSRPYMPAQGVACTTTDRRAVLSTRSACSNICPNPLHPPPLDPGCPAGSMSPDGGAQ